MPEPYDFDGALDEAFDRLHRDIASSATPPGAAGAVRGARRRRRTTFAAVAAVAALGVAGAGTGLAVHAHDSSIAPADGTTLPAPAALTPAALGLATSGWIDDWKTPTSDADLTMSKGDLDASMSCFSKSGANTPMDQAKESGSAVYTTPDGQLGYLIGLGFGDDSALADRASSSISDLLDACRPTDTSTETYDGGAHASFSEVPGSPGHTDVQIWVGRVENRIGVLVLNGASDAPSTDTVGAVEDQLVAAVQSDITFKPDRLLGGGVTTGSGTGSGDDGPMFPKVTAESLRAAFGTWTSGLDISADTTKMPQVPCADSDPVVSGVTSTSTASLGSTGLQRTITFSGDAVAERGLAAYVVQLRACTGEPYSVRQLGLAGGRVLAIATVEGREPATVWVVSSGPYLSSVAIAGGSNPPDSVSQAVAALLVDQLAHPRAASDPSSGPQPSQGGGSSQSSGSSSSSSSAPAAPSR